MDNGGPLCIAFGGLRVDDAIEEALLGVVGPGAIAAATAAAREAGERRDQVRDALSRDLEAARYAADRAFRQYDAADPANRLVASELEARWNRALAHAAEVEGKIAMHDAAPPAPIADPASLGVLASNLKAVWDAPTTDARLKKRIVRTLVHEVVADIDDAASEIVLIVHWVGGAHSELRLPKRRRGQRNSTSADIIQAVRQLVLIASDDLIAGLLNRNGLKTGNGNRWTRERVTSLRSYHHIPVFKPANDGIEPWLNLGNAAKLLKIAPKTLRLAAEAGEIEAFHPLSEGPWIFARASLITTSAQSIAQRARQNPRYPAGSRPISKVSSLQQHRQMGVLMRGCSSEHKISESGADVPRLGQWMWSTHSRRIDSINRSAKPFCQGEAGAIGLSRIPMVRNRRVTTAP